jgi:TPR repeat protein
MDATVAALQAQPRWLFPAGDCPADVASAREVPVNYGAEGCAQDARTCLAGCQQGDGNACYALALLIEAQRAIEPAQEALYLRACRLGVVSGCTNRAAYIVRIEPPDQLRLHCAVRTFRMACDRADPWGCTMLGELLAQGHGVPQDLDEALRVLPKGCSEGERDAACKRAKELEREIIARHGELGI